MATLERTWYSNLNVVTSDGATPTRLVQYRNIILELHNWIKAAGWDVVATSNGTVADTNDNISAVGDIVGDTATNPHTWMCYRSPVGWLYNSRTVEIVLDCLGPVGAEITVEMIHGLSFTGFTDINNRPTSSPERVSSYDTIVPETASLTPSHAHMGRTENGDWWFTVVEDGNGSPNVIMHAFTFDWTKTPNLGGPDNPEYACLFMYSQTNSNDVWSLRSNGLLKNSTSYVTFTVGGVPVSGLVPYSPVVWLNNWPGGISPASSKPHHSSAEFALDGANGRYLGKLVDIRWTPALLPDNRVEDNDPDDVRYITLGNVFIPVQTDQTPPNAPPFIL